jgi:glycosyltransferase involved in cell wall biosynthesis
MQSGLKLVSIVVPFYNEAEVIPTFYAKLLPCLEAIDGTAWQVVCVDDGSNDSTLSQLVEIAKRDKRFKIIELSRNFGKEAALTAGIEAARGDAVVAAWLAGAEVVLARRSDRASDGVLKRKTAAWFYQLHNKLAKTKIPANVGDFMKGLFAWVGFRTITIDYERAARSAGKTKSSGFALWNFALEGFTSFSTVPLKKLDLYRGRRCIGWSLLCYLHRCPHARVWC